MSIFYSPDVRNTTTGLDQRQVDERVLNVLNSSSAYGSYAPRSIPQSAVDTPIVTELPKGGSSEGDEITYIASSSNGNVWRLIYLPRASNKYPWHYIGGDVLASALTDGVGYTRASATYGDLTSSAAVNLTVPFNGDYRIEYGNSQWLCGTNGQPGYMKPGTSTPGDDTNSVITYRYHATSVNDINFASSKSIRLDGLTIGSTLKNYYRAGGGATLTVYDPYLQITPIRVGR